MGDYRLLARMDDSGSCESANHATAQCCRDGIGRNISLMVPGPAFAHAAKLFHDMPGISIGVHLTLNAEWDKVKWGPILGAAKVPALVEPDGMFTQNPIMLHERKPPVEQMLAEAKAQLATARAAGLKIDYIDEHMGVAWVSDLKVEMAALCQREGLVWGSGVKFHRLPTPKTGSLTERMISAIGDLSEPGDYLYVIHPGYDDDQFRAFTTPNAPAGQVARDRAEDTRMYCDPAVKKAIEDKGVRLVRYVNL